MEQEDEIVPETGQDVLQLSPPPPAPPARLDFVWVVLPVTLAEVHVPVLIVATMLFALVPPTFWMLTWMPVEIEPPLPS
jgi:hypothetical protein